MNNAETGRTDCSKLNRANEPRGFDPGPPGGMGWPRGLTLEEIERMRDEFHALWPEAREYMEKLCKK